MSVGDVVAVGVSVVAAFVFTASFALQQRANLEVMSAGGSGATTVMSRRAWILGIALQPVAFALQATALGIGSLIVVSTALTTELAFMAPAGAWVIGARPVRREFVAGLVVLAGLVAFVVGTQPQGGVEAAPFGDWAIPLVVLGVFFTGFLALGQVFVDYRAVLRGSAAGSWGALMGAITQQVVATGGEGLGPLLRGWATWALVVAGLVSILWVNLALRSGRLASALSAMASSTPVAAVFLGLTIFDERLSGGAAAHVVAGVGVVVVGLGISMVARSPSLVALEHAAEEPGGVEALDSYGG